MKNFLLLSLFFLTPVIMYSQDYVIKQNGEKLKCKIIRVDSLNIYCEIHNDNNYYRTNINKSDIKEIIYESEVKRQKYIQDSTKFDHDILKRNSFTIGFLEGGGSLVGCDVENLISKRSGVQLGLGYIGFGAAYNYHLKPYIRSSYLSIQYCYQGFAQSHTQSLIGFAFVYRSKIGLTGQLGLGKSLDKGPGLAADYKQPRLILTYAIGYYFPFSK